MRRRIGAAVTKPRDRRESSAVEEHDDARRSAPEVVTVERQGDRLTFDPKALAGQLGVPEHHVRVKKDKAGAVTVEVFRPMANTTFGWWEEYAPVLLG